MPTRSVYNQSSNHQVITNNNLNQLANMNPTNTNVDITSYIGKMLTINHHQVIVEDILGQGGFAFVFLVRSFNQHRYALKRMYVNNERDLIVCQREIAILKEFSSHTNIVKYIDSSIQRQSPPSQPKKPLSNDDDDDEEEDNDDSIYEILLLTEYCSNGSLIVSQRVEIFYRIKKVSKLFTWNKLSLLH
jgi:serine/threonine protein kinase